jgi:hypothetical protein
VIPALVAETKVVLISYRALFKVSLANTLVKAVPPVNPFIGVPASATASIVAVVVTVN